MRFRQCFDSGERVFGESPDDALAETMAADLRLNGDLLHYDAPGNTDVIDVAERRRGLDGRGLGVPPQRADAPVDEPGSTTSASRCHRSTPP